LENKECKELVIYGSNLNSTVNYLYFNKIVRHMVKIPSNLNSFLTGIIISDGFLKKTNSGNIILIFKQSIKNFDFLFTCFLKLAHFCQGYPRLDFTHLNGKVHYLILFATRAYPCFIYWHELFYVNNKKIVPSVGNKVGEFYNLLDFEALAY
jgi:LAGLIDADG DNA endonuclease family